MHLWGGGRPEPIHLGWIVCALLLIVTLTILVGISDLVNGSPPVPLHVTGAR